MGSIKRREQWKNEWKNGKCRFSLPSFLGLLLLYFLLVFPLMMMIIIMIMIKWTNKQTDGWLIRPDFLNEWMVNGKIFNSRKFESKQSKKRLASLISFVLPGHTYIHHQQRRSKKNFPSLPVLYTLVLNSNVVRINQQQNLIQTTNQPRSMEKKLLISLAWLTNYEKVIII